jgi:hypothetical protein
MIRLANIPSPHVVSTEHSVVDLFDSKVAPSIMHRPIPAPEPDPEPNPGPDAVHGASGNDGNSGTSGTSGNNGNNGNNGNSIAPADWDELYRAVQVRLQQCVDNALHKAQHTAPELRLQTVHEATKAAVLECVADMQRLHAALQLERQQRQAPEKLHGYQPSQQRQQAQLQHAQQHAQRH